MNKIKVYQTVFLREDTNQISEETFFENPIEIFSLWEEQETTIIKDLMQKIRDEENKQYRNDMKRLYVPAVSLDKARIMSIDIDGLENSPEVKQRIIDQLKNDEQVYCLQESVSGNLVIFYRFDCSNEDYPYLYYKKYLELTLRLEIEIDYLPELNRLRYVSLGEKYIYNKEAKPLTELLRVDRMLTPKKEVKIVEASKEAKVVKVSKGFEMLTRKASSNKVFKS